MKILNKINKLKVAIAILVIGLLVICAGLIADWGATHKLQKPVVVLFEAYTRPIVVEREQTIVIKPLAESQEQKNLEGIDAKIYDAFGVENYRVMRAIAVCESGMNPEAVNWNTRDIGLYQINWPVWEHEIREQFGYTLSDMFDTDKNIEVARWIWDRDGNGEGKVTPWVATNTSCFREEL